MASDLARSWRLHEQVAVRPEPFGALAYHFGTRRLSFLKTTKLARALQSLADHPTGLDACLAAGVEPAELDDYERAFRTLISSGILVQS